MTKAARVLGVPQHRLIHLCEKGVVVPDLADARGRGSSRAFSARNLFEFAVALEMRRMELPVTFIRAVLRVLRGFESAASSAIQGFSLPESLQAADAPRVTALIQDGERLRFSIGKGKAPAAIFGDVILPKRSRRGRPTGRADVRRLSTATAAKLVAAAKTRTEIDLTHIAAVLRDRGR